MATLSSSVEYDRASDYTTELELHKRLREYIYNELKTELSPIFARQLIANAIENSNDSIEESFQHEYKKIYKDLLMKVEQKFQKYSASENVRNQIVYYLQLQISNRLKISEISATMSKERDKLSRMVYNAEIDLKQCLDETIARIELAEKILATNEFEKIWKERFPRIEAIFDSKCQWRQVMNLVYRLYQTLDKTVLPDLNNVLDYLSSLSSLDTSNEQCSLPERLLQLRNECTCKVSDLNPIVEQSSDIGRRQFDHKQLNSFEFLNGEELNTVWLNKIEWISEENDISVEQKYQKFCQKISEEWPLFIRVFHFLEELTKSISEIFSSHYIEEPMFNNTLMQEIFDVLHRLTKNANLELNTFQLCISEDFYNFLHMYALMSIGLFYYDQLRTYFNQLLQSVEQSRNIMEDYFLRMVIPLTNDVENVVTNFLTDLCHVLHESFNREAKQTVQTQIEIMTAEFNRVYFIKELDNELYNASDDHLMRYILHPVDVLNERLDQQWDIFRKTIEKYFDITKNDRCQRLLEFFEIANTINTVLLSTRASSSTFVDELFEPSSGTVIEDSKCKRMCMAILFFRYLSGETTMMDVTIMSGPTYRVSAEWQEILKLWPMPSDKLKEIFHSINSKLETYITDHFELFLVSIVERTKSIEILLRSSIIDSVQNIFHTARQQLLSKQRGCTAQCPSCRRLCDFDHSSVTVSLIGRDENQHRCMLGHQIQAMGGLSFTITNKLSTVSCEQMENDDIITNQQGTMQQSWSDFKKIHFDWNFDKSEFSTPQNTMSMYIWNRIGKQLCEYYGNEMEFVISNNASLPSHFILLFGYSARLTSEDGSFYQWVLHKFAKGWSSETNDVDQRRLSLRKYLVKNIANFIIRMKEKANSADRMSVIVGGPNVICVYRTARLDDININEIDELISNRTEPINFSTAFKLINDILSKIQADSKSNTLRHTIILMIDGKLEVFPIDELAHLCKIYRSRINNFYTVTFDKDGMETLTRINEITHGTLMIVDQTEDLREAYLKITSDCDARSLILTNDRSTDSCATSSSQQTTTSQQKEKLEDLFIPRISEDIIYNQIYKISLPSRREDILPDILLSIIEQTIPHETNRTNDILIPLPIFSKRSIDHLPTINITLAIESVGFICNQFLNCFAKDIGIDQNNLFAVEVREGSINIKIKLSKTIADDEVKLENIKEILLTMNLPASKNFVSIEIQNQRARSDGRDSQTNPIRLELENFNKTEIDRVRLTSETINNSLRMSQFITTLSQSQSQFLEKKSQQIAKCLMHAFRECAFDYVLENALLPCNKTLVDQYKRKYGRSIDNEKVLFHGTSIENLDGIFQNNFQYNANVKRTDKGWYGKGIYFSSSPRKALCYARPWKDDSIRYIICSLVAVGKSLTIRNMSYKGRAMHPDYDSHYVRTSFNTGEPIADDREPFYEEFVIKQSERILPLFIVGIRRAYRCVIWRDAKVTNEANATLLADMRRRSVFNIYESETSRDTLNVLQSKFSEQKMNCAVITNGANEGKEFVTECRKLRANIPVIVYCKKKDYHQQWAMTLAAPEVKVTGNVEEVFQFIDETLK